MDPAPAEISEERPHDHVVTAPGGTPAKLGPTTARASGR
ncbi:MAG: hypothetical protein AVDCRST_MAG18-421 [uncultured Thermomicrobiales bacterium]|uniref:Uncharacterized protein n=1 Tax=uncultured Thermomicrobiales bacterium TaxID=1645740 RepID=A0A6J4UMP1_9BACT|nr:MAG: hypothetical protein AVDCRST_MAG18-421 [uncultured Thermomicrobiales bacterium]